MLRALPTRYLPVWTPDDFDAAIAAATNGSMRLAADMAAAIMQDDCVRGVLGARTHGLLGLPITWDPTEPIGWYALAKEEELNRLLQWGLVLGVGFAHIECNGSLTTWHPRWFDCDIDGIWHVTTKCGRVALDSSWLVYTPYGSQEPWFLGLWLALAIPFLVKRYSVHDRARASEVFGSAMIVGKAPEGANEEKRAKWLTDLERLSRSSRVVLPEGYSLDLLEAQGQTWGIYDTSTAWADNASTVAIAGQVVTTQGTTGFSKGDVHERIARSLLRFTAETLSTCLGGTYVPRVWGFTSYPRYAVDPPADLKAFADTLTALGAGIGAMKSQGIAVDTNALARMYGVPVIAAAPAPLAPVVPLRAVEEASALPAHEATLAEALTASADGRGTSAPPVDIGDTPPTEFRIFAKGANAMDHGTFTPDISAIIADRGSRDVMIDLEHLSLDPTAPNYDPDARGWLRLEERAGELWAVGVRWTADGIRRITGRLQRAISPTFKTEGQRITGLVNVALTALPAMHEAQPLIAASVKGNKMDPKLLAMLGLPPDATPEAFTAALNAFLEATRGALALPPEATTNDIVAALSAEETPAGEAPTAATAAPAPTQQVAASALVNDLSKRVSDLDAKLEKEARARLMSARPLKPWEKRFLDSQSTESVRLYMASAPTADANPTPPARDQEDGNAALAARKALGIHNRKAGK